MRKALTAKQLCKAAASFASQESQVGEPLMYGVTDGKAVGTYLEQKFRKYVALQYEFDPGNSASGIDFPALEIDVKCTSVRQPQSSCPFRSARQKIYGLGYSLLVFVYEKLDDDATRTSRLDIRDVIFVDKSRTADYQTTRGLLEILDRDGTTEDILAFLEDRRLPSDDIESRRLAEEIVENRPLQGYLTISNALQWRLQYGRVITAAGTIDGILRVK